MWAQGWPSTTAPCTVPPSTVVEESCANIPRWSPSSGHSDNWRDFGPCVGRNSEGIPASRRVNPSAVGILPSNTFTNYQRIGLVFLTDFVIPGGDIHVYPRSVPFQYYGIRRSDNVEMALPGMSLNTHAQRRDDGPHLVSHNPHRRRLALPDLRGVQRFDTVDPVGSAQIPLVRHCCPVCRPAYPTVCQNSILKADFADAIQGPISNSLSLAIAIGTRIRPSRASSGVMRCLIG